MAKSKSLLCAILSFLIYFFQAILYNLLTGSFDMRADTATIISCLFAVFFAALLINNKKRVEYFGFNLLKIDKTTLYYLPLIAIPMVNLLYLLCPERSIIQDIFICLFNGIYVGIMEELIFRGFLFRAIEERLNVKWAISVSSILFGLYHLVNLNAMPVELVIIQIIYAIAIGISFAIVFHISNSLLPCIIIHTLTDIVAFLFTTNMRYDFEIIGLVITILIAVFYGIIYAKNIIKIDH